MRKRYFLLALAFACFLPLCACADMLSALEALVPGATGDAFEPYQSTSPNGAWILDVRKVEDEDSGMSFAAIRVLSAETGEKFYDCPDRWRLWDLHGIDWLCDGTILVDSSDTGMARYGADTEGAWRSMDAQAGLASLASPYDDGYARIYEQDGWRTVEVCGDHGHAYISLDAEGKTRLDMLHSNLTLAELEETLAENAAQALKSSAFTDARTEEDGALRYLTDDLYSAVIRDGAIASAERLPL